ncbi:hypothetical protein HDU67_002685 [Dinochytrium kinnereticum]|nr:hypothetical protein HDU67_002685 [Dinochytrium kinnereticum]
MATRKIPWLKAMLRAAFPGVKVICILTLVVLATAWIVSLSQVPAGYMYSAEFILYTISLSMNLLIPLQEHMKQTGKTTVHIIAVEGIGKIAQRVEESVEAECISHVEPRGSKRKNSSGHRRVAPKDIDDMYETEIQLPTDSDTFLMEIPCLCSSCRDQMYSRASKSAVFHSLLAAAPVSLLTLAISLYPIYGVTSQWFFIPRSIYIVIAAIYQVSAIILHWLGHAPTTLLGILMTEICRTSFLIHLRETSIQIESLIRKIQSASTLTDMQTLSYGSSTSCMDKFRSQMKRLSSGFALYFVQHHMNAAIAFIFIVQAAILYLTFRCVPLWAIMSAFTAAATSLLVALAGAGINELILKVNTMCLNYEGKFSEILGTNMRDKPEDDVAALELLDMRHRIVASQIEQLQCLRADNHTVVKVLGMPVGQGFKSQVFTVIVFAAIYMAQIFYHNSQSDHRTTSSAQLYLC